MAKLNGQKMLVLVNTTAIGATSSFTLNLTSSNIDVSSKDSNSWTDRIYGKRDWNVSFDGLFDPSGTFNAEEIFDLLDNQTRVFLQMATIDGVGGGTKFTGYAVCSGLTISAPNDGATTFSGTFEADGELNKGVVATS